MSNCNTEKDDSSPQESQLGATTSSKVSPKIRNEILNFLQTNAVLMPFETLHCVLFKKEQRGEVWLKDGTGKRLLFATFNLKTNPSTGTKLYANDRQTPEGIYTIDSLKIDTFSQFFLHFPNEFDRRKAIADHRPTRLGTFQLTSHPTASNTAFLEEETLQQLAFLMALGEKNATIVIAPFDFTQTPLAPPCRGCPVWSGELYAQLKWTLEDVRQSSK